MQEPSSVGALLVHGIERLRGHSAGEILDAETLLAACLGLSRARLRGFPELEPDSAQIERYLAWIERRRAGEPIAYITGQREFWSLPLAVGPAVLVPRPETELVVERTLALEHGAPLRVLDLGTGSGAIALALAHERPAWQVTAIDVSAAALALARANGATLGMARVRFLEGSWFDPVAGERFDLIVSNPPYIGADDPALKDATLRHEPRAALSPGTDALAALREIVTGAPACLEPGGWLVLEHGMDQAAALRAALVARGFARVRCHRDLAGHERVTEAQWPEIRNE